MGPLLLGDLGDGRIGDIEQLPHRFPAQHSESVHGLPQCALDLRNRGVPEGIRKRLTTGELVFLDNEIRYVDYVVGNDAEIHWVPDGFQFCIGYVSDHNRGCIW